MKFIAAACIKGDNKVVGIKIEDRKGEGPGKVAVRLVIQVQQCH